MNTIVENMFAQAVRLANSSYCGAGRRVGNVKEAVQILGLDTFRNLIISSALVGSFPKISGFDLPSFWAESMLVANLAHLIGKDIDTDREMLFSAGLMHSIGRLLIFLCLPAEAAAAAAAESLRGLDLAQQRETETRLLQASHFEVGMELTRRWNFPEIIQSAVGRYDMPAADDQPARIVHAAVRIANGIRNSATLHDMQAALPQDIAEALHLDMDWFMENGEVFDVLLQEAATLAQ